MRSGCPGNQRKQVRVCILSFTKLLCPLKRSSPVRPSQEPPFRTKKGKELAWCVCLSPQAGWERYMRSIRIRISFPRKSRQQRVLLPDLLFRDIILIRNSKKWDPFSCYTVAEEAGAARASSAAGRSTQPREEPGGQQWMVVPAFALIFSS